MAYTKIGPFVNVPEGTAPPAGADPLSADNINHFEDGIASAAATADSAQSALAGKADASHTHTAAQISNSTATGRSLVTATDAAAARTTIGAVQAVTAGAKLWVGTKTAYDAIASKDATTLYATTG